MFFCHWTLAIIQKIRLVAYIVIYMFDKLDMLDMFPLPPCPTEGFSENFIIPGEACPSLFTCSAREMRSFFAIIKCTISDLGLLGSTISIFEAGRPFTVPEYILAENGL